MQLILTVISLSLLHLTIAAGTCSSSGALAWPPVGDCSVPSKFGTIVETCRACCLNDADCFQICTKSSGLRKRDAIGEQLFGAMREKRDLTGRAVALTCTTNEGCYKFTDGSLLCLNLGTGLYHDDVGGNGDYFSGEYTSPDGKVQTGTSAATATDDSEASSSGASQTTGTGTSIRTISAGAAGITSAAGASATSAVASATSQAGGDILRVGSNVGLAAFVAGLVI